MNTLALDTSHDTLHLALEGDGFFDSVRYTVGRKFTEQLMTEISHLLDRHGSTSGQCRPADLHQGAGFVHGA